MFLVAYDLIVLAGGTTPVCRPSSPIATRFLCHKFYGDLATSGLLDSDSRDASIFWRSQPSPPCRGRNPRVASGMQK